MAANVLVTVDFPTTKEDWGTPEVSELLVIWTRDKIYDSQDIIFHTNFHFPDEKDYEKITENIAFESHEGKKEFNLIIGHSGFINVFMLQDWNYYRMGEKNIPILIDQITKTETHIDWK